ncbi:hypothetical protein L226DRAFT_614203 [Lentinus tigrinus ALCF2SS1-7]|uniref:uncharacterized protein n=1 Tax=Lentinus tigrinus ALCF2SS1-7 TaxID=1328758 RepID=UPI0011662B95|nr:hypothetical protein L226DRAFT_614203 [Lentinus tigrinus ALCF2SS1-7]
MSSDANADAAALVALYDNLYKGEYCIVASLVLFFYDAITTLIREVTCFRTGKWSGSLLLFLANKGISGTLYVVTVVKFGSFFSDESCIVFQKVSFAIQLLQMIPWAAFSALRAYVLSHSKPLGFLVLGLSLAPVGANLVHYGGSYGFAGINLPPFGCLYTDNTSEALNRTFTISSRAPLIVADVLLIYITWTKLSNRDVLRGISRNTRLSLSDIILRDGTVYFIVLFFLNVLHLAFSLLSLEKDGNQASYVTTFTAPITTILVSRFLLQLQEANQAAIGLLDPDDSMRHSTPTSLASLSFVRSLGGAIDPDLPGDDDVASLSDQLSRGVGEDGDALPSSCSTA